MKYAAILLIVASIAAGCGGQHSADTGGQAEASIMQAATYPVEVSAQGMQYQAVGSVKSVQSSTIQSNAVGHITAVNVREGDSVEAGAVLVELDSREADAMVQKAESTVTQAQKSMEEVGKSALAADSARAAADAELALAKSTYDRYKNLSENQAISKQVLDEATAKMKAAEAEVNRATETANAFTARKAEAAAMLQQAQAGLDSARVQLSHTKVIAPFSGIITAKYADVGDLASPGVSLLSLEDNKHYRLEAMVDEARAGMFKVGDAAPVTIEALGPEPLPGRVAEIVPKTDPSSRSVIIKIGLPEHAGLQSGMFGRVTFQTGQKQAMTVPVTAVFERGQLKYVFIVHADSRARLRLVQTGKQYGDLVEILSGLNAGETVVTSRVAEIADGTIIEPGATPRQ
jgi:multidrug efflux pump subunit AcrA (membrane-fusion protein)